MLRGRVEARLGLLWLIGVRLRAVAILGWLLRGLIGLGGTPGDGFLASQQHFSARGEAKEAQQNALRQKAEIAERDPHIRPIVAVRQIVRALADGTLLVDEAPCANQFTQPMHRTTAAKQYFHNRGGALGWGMPASVGVSLAHDKSPVLCLVGDGSALYSPQALWSAVHEETPVVFVILNNAEYGILKEFMLNQPQYNAQKDGFLAMDICHPEVDFQSLARSMGVAAQKVTSKAEISGMIEAALASGKPQLIEIPVTKTSAPSPRLV